MAFDLKKYTQECLERARKLAAQPIPPEVQKQIAEAKKRREALSATNNSKK